MLKLVKSFELREKNVWIGIRKKKNFENRSISSVLFFYLKIKVFKEYKNIPIV